MGWWPGSANVIPRSISNAVAERVAAASLGGELENCPTSSAFNETTCTEICARFHMMKSCRC